MTQAISRAQQLCTSITVSLYTPNNSLFGQMLSLTDKAGHFSYLIHIYAHIVCVYIIFLYFTFLLAKKVGATIYLLRDSLFVFHGACLPLFKRFKTNMINKLL